jgi:EAL domain-containing protein (putative c-di-GMP-specific phosphodiesterase class I)
MADDGAVLRAAARAAVDQPGILRIAFQPVVDLARGVVTGFEALARFAGPPDATPDRWFAAAHEARVGEQLEARAVHRALGARDQLPPNTFLTVNVGPSALLSPSVRHVLDAAGDLRGVVLEITEQQPIHDYRVVNAVLQPLRERGVLVAVDDAGAGFSSLKHITMLRPDIIKVDRDLVAGIDLDATRSAVIETLGIFASRLDAWLLAEGVETPGELGRLLDLGVPLAQGYLLGRPNFAMRPAEAQAAEICHRRARLARRSPLAALAGEAPSVAAQATEAQVAEAFLRSAGQEWLIAVDEFQRPVALLARDGRQRLPALCVGEADGLSDVVRRALSRAGEQRFAPVALCDDLGRVRGLISPERLFERLADVADERAAA